MLILLLAVVFDLGWVLPETVFEARIKKQIASLESGPRKHWLRRGEVRNGRKEANRGGVSCQARDHRAQRELNPVGALGGPV